MAQKKELSELLRAVWRFIRIFVVVFLTGTLSALVLFPQEKWFEKTTILAALAAGVAALFKYIRDKYCVDLKIL